MCFVINRFLEEVVKKEADKDDTVALAQEILGKCHPDAVSVIRHWITIIQSRWEEVMAWANQVSLRTPLEKLVLRRCFECYLFPLCSVNIA